MRLLILILSCLFTVTSAQINYDAGVENGRITFYAQSPTVACDIPQSEWPQYTTALSEKHFQGGLACGATVRIMNNGKEIQAMVVDLCPVKGNEQWCSGDMTHFDLGNQSTFAQLENPVTGVKLITFQWLPTPVGNTPVKLRFKDGINAYWVAMEVINHRYPVAKLEIKDPQTGNWKTGDRTKPGMYNYWQFDFTGNGLTPPFQVRITDQYGQVIEETGTVVQEKYMWAGKNQFPLMPQHVGLKDPTSPTEAMQRTLFHVVQNSLLFPRSSSPTVRIFNSAGRMVADLAVHNAVRSFALPNVPAGVYMIRLSYGAMNFTLHWVKMD